MGSSEKAVHDGEEAMLTALTILVDGLVYSSWLFIVAVGLTLIFGVMKVLNVAHGGFYSIGAYTAAWAVGLWFNAGWAPLGSFAVLILAALVAGVVVGAALERGILRFVYGRDEVLVVLVTYAVFLILENLVLQIWGVDAYLAYQPSTLLGTTRLLGLAFLNYELMLIPLAGVIAFGLVVPQPHAHRQDPARCHPRSRDEPCHGRQRVAPLHPDLRRRRRARRVGRRGHSADDLGDARHRRRGHRARFRRRRHQR